MAREGAPQTESLDRVIAWRYSNYDTPFWARSNTRDGRWNLSREAAVQYLTLEPNAAWAELIRAEELRDEADVATVRMAIWVATLNEVVVDYSTFAKAESAGFPAEALVDDDWTLCQAEGRRLRELGHAGVMAPSAALPGAVNVTLFGPRILWDWNREPGFSAAVPATVAAVGSPPPGLAARVRFFGQEHQGLSEHKRITAVRNRRPRASSETDGADEEARES